MGTSSKRGGVVEFVKGDIWIVLLDIISVNAAYFLGILIRFFVWNHIFGALTFLMQHDIICL